MYLQFISFLHTEMTQVIALDKDLPIYMINIKGADDLATQGARASATMILT